MHKNKQKRLPFTVSLLMQKVKKIKISTYDHKRYNLIDSSVIKNNACSFKLPINEPVTVLIQVGDSSSIFMVNNGLNVFKGNYAQFSKARLENNGLNEISETYAKTISNPARSKIVELMQLEVKRQPTKELSDSLEIVRTALYKSIDDETKEFIKNNRQSFYALDLLYHYYQFWNIDTVNQLYKVLSTANKSTPTGKKIGVFLFDLYETTARPFPLDSLQFISQTKLNKSAEYYIIDFWGSWCKPCIEKIPDIKKQLPVFDKKQIQVIGIAAENKGNDSSILKIINRFEVDWAQSLHYMGEFNTPNILKRYQVVSYPTYFLVDKKGKLIRRGLGENGFVEILDALGIR